MILNEEKWRETLNKKVWLVYLISSCEQGSEGWSGWQYHAVALGDTDEEIYNNWVKNVREIYSVDLSKDLKCTNGFWSCYYPLCKNELPTEVYGDSQPLFIEAQYRKHLY